MRISISLRSIARPLLVATLLLAGVDSLPAGEVRPEIIAYNKALMKTQDRTELLTTVFSLSGESPESAKDLAERLSKPNESAAWAEETVAEFFEPQEWIEPGAKLVVAFAIKEVAEGGELDGRSAMDYNRILFVDPFSHATG